METRSFRVEKEFGLVVGAAFALLGGWWFYRGKFLQAAEFILPCGALLMLLGFLWPRALVLPSRAWMRLAEALSFVTTRIILALVFFLIVTPIGVIKRAFGWTRSIVGSRDAILTGCRTPNGSAIRVTTKKCFEGFEMSKTQVVSELWQFMRENKKYWLAPIVITLVLVGALLVLAKSSAVAPFIYTLF